MIIFDLGGVVIDFDIGSILKGYSYYASGCEEKLKTLLADPTSIVEQWSTGKISSETYFSNIEKLLSIRLSKSVHTQIDLSCLLGERFEMVKILRFLNKRFNLACLSNTHETHWDYIQDKYQCMAYFDVRFASHLIGAKKPDRSIFKLLIEYLETKPSRCIFIDDSAENIKVASALGML